MPVAGHAAQDMQLVKASSLEDLSVTLKALKADRIVLDRVKNEEHSEDTRSMLKWRSGRAVIDIRDRFATRAHGVAEQAPYMYAVPMGQVRYCKWRPAFRKEVPRAVSSLERLHDKHENNIALLDFLSKKCEPIIDVKLARIPSQPKHNPLHKPACIDAKVCLCGDVGDRAFVFKKLLVAAMKKHTQAVPGGVHVLDQGELIVRIIELDRQDNGDHGETEGGINEFWGCPYTYWSPYRPSFRTLMFEGCTAMGHVLLCGSHSYDMLWQLVQDVAGSTDGTLFKVWFYRMHTSDRPIIEIRPDLFLVDYSVIVD